MQIFAAQYAANGHFYTVVTAAQGWPSAQASAASLPAFRGIQGHLATLTSAGESTFVAALLGGVSAWIDGQKSAFWMFTTGPEAGAIVAYFNWGPGSPSSSTCMSMLGSGLWADAACGTALAYVVEYECPYGGVFLPAGCSIAINPGNGHVYEVVPASLSFGGALSAAAARSFRGAPGHLATVVGAGENQFIASLLGPSQLSAWIDASKSGSTWVFSSGPEATQALAIGNWLASPSNTGSCSDMLSSGFWDVVSCALPQYYVAEYECAPGFTFNATACTGAPHCAV